MRIVRKKIENKNRSVYAVLTVHMVGGMAICGGSEDVREGRMGIGGGCGTIGGTLAPAISGRRNHDATEAHWKK